MRERGKRETETETERQRDRERKRRYGENERKWKNEIETVDACGWEKQPKQARESRARHA